MCLSTKFKSLASKFLKIIRLICMHISLYECIISKNGSGAHGFNSSSLLIEFLEVTANGG